MAFPLAAQPDILRAAQKDDYFLALFRDECRELASALMGNRSAAWEAETDLVSSLCYHTATTGAARATLGEEYCDIAQVTAFQPTLLMLARKLAPQRRLPPPPPSLAGAAGNKPPAMASASSSSAAAAPPNANANNHANGANSGNDAVGRPKPSPAASPPAMALPPSATAAAAPNAAAVAAIDSKSPAEQPNGSTAGSAAGSAAAAGVLRSGASATSAVGGPIPIVAFHPPLQWRYPSLARRTGLIALQTVIPYLYQKMRRSARRMQTTDADSPLRRFVSRVWNRTVSFVMSADGVVSGVQRWHLAVFYLFGAYFAVSHRLAGVRFAFLRAVDVERPRYTILGIMLTVQLMAGALLALRSALRARAHRLEEQRREREWSSAAAGAGAGPSAAAADEKGAGAGASAGAAVDADGEEDANAKCTLCLSARRQTTATECGHLFCWSCISESITNKAECPLCRHSVVLTNLVRLAHYQAPAAK